MSSYDINFNKIDGMLQQELVQLSNRLIDDHLDYNKSSSRQWIENYLFFAGSPNSISNNMNRSTVTGRSVDVRFKRKRATTSVPKIFKAVKIVASDLTRNRPSIKVVPVSDEEVDERKANLSNILLDYLWDVDDEEKRYKELVTSSLLFSVVARKDTLNFGYEMSRLWPKLVEDRDPDTGQTTMVQVKDPNTGEPIFEQLPWPKSEVISSFRLLLPPNADNVMDVEWVGDVSIKRKDWIEQNYGIEDEGFLPDNIDKVRGGGRLPKMLAIEELMKKMSFGNGSIGADDVVLGEDQVVHVHLFIRPTKEFRRGREIAIAGEQVVYDGESRYYYEEPDVNYHPYSFLSYGDVPGRVWGASYVEKLTTLQKEYDESRREVSEIRRKLSRPKMLMPTGSQIDRGAMTGDIEVLRYNPFGADGGKPSFLSPPALPSTVVEDLNLRNSEFQEISSVTEIRQGIHPKGVTTFRGLNILREEATNSENNPIRNFERAIEKSQLLKLLNLKKSLIYPNRSLISSLKIFKRKYKSVSDVDIIEFVGDDLGGSVSVEPLSTVAKSSLAHQEKIFEMAKLGVLGDIVNDPDLNNEFKKVVGVTGFDTPTNKQVRLARHENRLMLQADKLGDIVQIQVEQWHDDVLHIREIELMLLDPNLNKNSMAYKSLELHREQHIRALAFKQAQSLKNAAPGNAEQISSEVAAEQGVGKGGGQTPPPRDKVSNQDENNGVAFGPATGFMSGPEPQVV